MLKSSNIFFSVPQSEFGEIMRMLKSPWRKLAAIARMQPLAARGSHVYNRGLIEFSNICRRNCLYCGLRRQNTRLRRYILSEAQILAAAGAAAQSGVDTIVLQSGEGACGAKWLAHVVAEIRSQTNLPVTLSVGERSPKDYEIWRRAGASRYLLKHETSDQKLYRCLHPGHDLRERAACLNLLKSLDYEIGGGFMIGLPGQTLASLARDVLFCRELGVDMCGAGPFIAQKDTPLAGCPSGSPELALSVLAALRIFLPNANLPATTALATVDPVAGQTNGLLAGANVLMPSFTPDAAAQNYVIYDSKNRVSVANAAKAITAAGRVHTLAV